MKIIEERFMFSCSISLIKISKVLLSSLSSLLGWLLIGCLVEEGDRVAQLILERIVTPEITEVDVRSLSLSSLWVCTDQGHSVESFRDCEGRRRFRKYWQQVI